MEIYVIGIIKNNPRSKSISGFRLMSAQGNNVETKDVTYNQLKSAMLNNQITIKNAKIENNEIKGINGSLDRYGIPGQTQSVVILRETHTDGKFTGYVCSDTNGNVRNLSEEQAITFAEKFGVANGKVVHGDNNSKHISAIEGTYEIWNRSGSTTVDSKDKTEDNVQKTLEEAKVHKRELPDDIKNLIAKLRTFKEYKGSFTAKVVYTVEKFNKCSDKQLEVLKKALNEWSKNTTEPKDANSNTNQNTTPSSSVQTTSNSVNTTPINTKADKYRHNIDNSAKVTNDILSFTKLSNGQIYVSGFRSDIEVDKLPVNLVIPDTVVIDGKEQKISGIHIGAFKKSKIERLETGKNIIDIGQSAFEFCSELYEVDLSKSRNTHIPMNCFLGCKDLTIVKFGELIQRIHESALEGCSSLEEINIPPSVETIARAAFRGCNKLKTVNSKVKTINESAFAECEDLNTFDFSTVLTIGSFAFSRTGFSDLDIPGTVTSLGAGAFKDCMKLKSVRINEGTETIGDRCFIKSSSASRNFLVKTNNKAKGIEVIDTPKSITSIGNDAFSGVELVKGYTGSVAESHCLGFNVPFEAYDMVNRENSANARIKSNILGSDPVKLLYEQMQIKKDNLSNPPFEMNTSKLIDISLPDDYFNALNIEKTNDVVEPAIKFKATVNFLQDTGDLFNLPLSPKLTRMFDTFYIEPEELYNDGCNRIYKVKYSIKDSLENGSYYLILMNNTIKFMTECTEYNDITIDSKWNKLDENVIADPFIHVGDIIGESGTISGKRTFYRPEGQYRTINVGNELLEMYKHHGIQINVTRNDCYMYEPVVNKVLQMHNAKNDDGKKKCNILDIITYEQFIKDASNKFKKNNLKNDRKFFEALRDISDAKLARIKRDLSYIEIEKEAQLFQVSKQFNQFNDENNAMSPEIFNELARSYWMISKDTQWLKQTGTKSLNKTKEYNIGKYKLIEYKSNQVVKFSNPYMNGQKGAYVFTLNNGSSIVGVYASRYSLKDIIDKLIELTYIPSGIDIPTLMTDANNIDRVDARLFYDFYDVLYSSNGWSFNNYVRFNMFSGLSGEFKISMYKPTGIFYLIMKKYMHSDDNRGLKAMPILPIGNMNRALMVATTTNSNFKDSHLLKELITLSMIESAKDIHNIDIERLKANLEHKEISIDGYYKARQLAIDGVTEVDRYLGLVDDRVIYMMGALHKGKLQREFDSGNIEELEDDDYIDFGIDDPGLDVDDSELELDDSKTYSNNDIELEDDNEDIEFEDDDDFDEDEITVDDLY